METSNEKRRAPNANFKCLALMNSEPTGLSALN
jgi:hypothetical protein